MTKKLIFGKNNRNNSHFKNPLSKNLVTKNSSFQSTKNSKSFNYHQRLPFKFAIIELKYIRNIIGFVGITLTLLLVLQNLTAYSSNFDPKIQTVRLITNFNQNQQTNESSQKNIIKEYNFGNSINPPTVGENLDKNKNFSTKKLEDINNPNTNPKNIKKSSEQSSQKIRIKKYQKSENNLNKNSSSTGNLQQENSAQNSTNLEEKN